ncbi:MAG: hypothetical protein VX741_07760, partial [Pseudomonadota bacterium]|nr:hypothetical protein [Pseudomonadota bacterium]
MTHTVISNIGECFTGDISSPTANITSLLIADGQIESFDPPTDAARDLEIDAGGVAVMPGLIDGHIHPVMGEWTPTQDTI